MDIEEVDRSGGCFVKFVEGIICDNLEFNQFERIIKDMTDKRNKFEEKNETLLQTLTKKFLNQIMVVV